MGIPFTKPDLEIKIELDDSKEFILDKVNEPTVRFDPYIPIPSIVVHTAKNKRIDAFNFDHTGPDYVIYKQGVPLQSQIISTFSTNRDLASPSNGTTSGDVERINRDIETTSLNHDILAGDGNNREPSAGHDPDSNNRDSDVSPPDHRDTVGATGSITHLTSLGSSS